MKALERKKSHQHSEKYVREDSDRRISIHIKKHFHSTPIITQQYSAPRDNRKVVVVNTFLVNMSYRHVIATPMLLTSNTLDTALLDTPKPSIR